MAVEVLKDGGLYVDGYEFSDYIQGGTLDYNADVLDRTCWGHTHKMKKAGLTNTILNYDALYDNSATGMAKQLFDRIGQSSPLLVSVLPEGRTPGTRAFFFQAVEGNHGYKWPVGELIKIGASLEGHGNLIRGTLMERGQKSSSANGTARNLGQVSAGQTLYAQLHVIAVKGTNPTLDVVVESDNAEAFTTPTTRLTFTQATGLTAELKSFTGLVSDDWFRVKWTIGGTDTPKFTLMCVIGIK